MGKNKRIHDDISILGTLINLSKDYGNTFSLSDVDKCLRLNGFFIF